MGAEKELRKPGGVPTAQFSPTKIDAELKREEQVQEAQRRATPVPQSFDQAVNWAAAASIMAAEAGKLRQKMFYNAGGPARGMSGSLGDCLAFAQLLCRKLAQSPALEGGKLKVVFADCGAMGQAQNRWDDIEDLKAVMEIVPMPVVNRNEVPDEWKQKEIDKVVDADFLVIVAPRQQELPALLQLYFSALRQGRDVPILMLNDDLITDEAAIIGAVLDEWRRINKKFIEIFHLEQIDEPEAYRDGNQNINSCVIARVYPRPWTVWEDCPEDPDAVDGYFLIDLTDDELPKMEDVRALLTYSAQAREAMMKPEKR